MNLHEKELSRYVLHHSSVCSRSIHEPGRAASGKSPVSRTIPACSQAKAYYRTRGRPTVRYPRSRWIMAGISVELWRQIANELGLEYDFRETNLSGTFFGLARAGWMSLSARSRSPPHGKRSAISHILTLPPILPWRFQHRACLAVLDFWRPSLTSASGGQFSESSLACSCSWPLWPCRFGFANAGRTLRNSAAADRRCVASVQRCGGRPAR
jgi:hypothetical protein